MRSFLIMENNLPVCLEDLDFSFRKFTHAGEREDWRKINWTIWHRSISNIAKNFNALSSFVDASKRSFPMEDLIILLYANAALSCKGDPGKASANTLFIQDTCKWLYRNRKKWTILFYQDYGGSCLWAVSSIFFTTQERTFLVSHSHCITSDTYLGEGDPVYNTQILQIDKNKKNV